MTMTVKKYVNLLVCYKWDQIQCLGLSPISNFLQPNSIMMSHFSTLNNVVACLLFASQTVDVGQNVMSSVF